MKEEISDWTGSWPGNVTPQLLSEEKSVKPSILWDICISQKHFCICKERIFRLLDHQEGSLLHSDVVQSQEHFNDGALYEEKPWSGAIKNPVQHLR